MARYLSRAYGMGDTRHLPSRKGRHQMKHSPTPQMTSAIDEVTSQIAQEGQLAPTSRAVEEGRIAELVAEEHTKASETYINTMDQLYKRLEVDMTIGFDRNPDLQLLCKLDSAVSALCSESRRFALSSVVVCAIDDDGGLSNFHTTRRTNVCGGRISLGDTTPTEIGEVAWLST
jgi:hypothetical protein